MKYLVAASEGRESLYATNLAVFNTRRLATEAIEQLGSHCNPDVDMDVYDIDYVRWVNNKIMYFWVESIPESITLTTDTL